MNFNIHTTTLMILIMMTTMLLINIQLVTYIIVMMSAGESKIRIGHIQNIVIHIVALGMLDMGVMRNGVIGTVFADGSIPIIGTIR